MVVRHLETSPPTSASVRSRQSVWLRVFRRDHWHKWRVSSSRSATACDVMYNLRCGASCRVCTPRTLAPCSNDAQTFFIPMIRLARSSLLERPAAVSAGWALLDLETHGYREGWPAGHEFLWYTNGQSSRRENCDNSAMGEDIDFVKRLGANVVVNYHKEHSVEFVFDNLEFQAYGNCQERLSSLSEIMQIVTSAVRIESADLLRKELPFCSAKFVRKLVVFVHIDTRVCMLQEPALCQSNTTGRRRCDRRWHA